MATQIVVVYNKIPALMAFVETEARAAVKKNADLIAHRAKAYAPVATGALRDSIESSSVTAGKQAEVTVGAEYAGYVEYGTYKMPPRPFLQRAVSDVQDQFFADVGSKLFARF